MRLKRYYSESSQFYCESCSSLHRETAFDGFLRYIQHIIVHLVLF